MFVLQSGFLSDKNAKVELIKKIDDDSSLLLNWPSDWSTGWYKTRYKQVVAVWNIGSKNSILRGDSHDLSFNGPIANEYFQNNLLKTAENYYFEALFHQFKIVPSHFENQPASVSLADTKR